MAKPDFGDGWLKISHELHAAIAVADFTKGGNVVLREALAQKYGPSRRVTFILSPADIARRCGMGRSNVMHAITELIGSNVLVRRSDGSLSLEEDYERWTRKGARRLSDAEIAYARSAPLILKVGKFGALSNQTTNPSERHECVVQSDNEALSIQTTAVVQSDNEALSIQTTAVVQSDNGLLSIQTTGCCPDRQRPPIRNAGAPARGNSQKEEERRNTKTPPSSPPPPGPRADADAALRLAAELFGPEQATAIGRQIDDIDARIKGRWDCFAASLREASRVSYRIGNLPGYCVSRALTFLRDGIPPDAVEPAPKRAREDDDPPYFEYFEITPEMRARQEAEYRKQAKR